MVSRELWAQGKTDPKDAQLLAAFGEARRPYPSRVPTANERVLRELVARRDDLVALIGAEKNRLLVARDPRIRHHIAASLADAETRRAEIEREIDHEIDHLITGDPLLVKRRAQLRTVPGVGWVTSIVLLAYLPELGEMDRRQIAALAGLAPYADDSGTPHKARHCSGGRSQVRRAMYLAAMTCVTHARVKRTVYRDHYHEMSPAKGAKSTLVAIARRMLVLINAMVRDDLTWDDTDIGRGLHARPVPRRTMAPA